MCLSVSLSISSIKDKIGIGSEENIENIDQRENAFWPVDNITGHQDIKRNICEFAPTGVEISTDY